MAEKSIIDKVSGYLKGSKQYDSESLKALKQEIQAQIKEKDRRREQIKSKEWSKTLKYGDTKEMDSLKSEWDSLESECKALYARRGAIVEAIKEAEGREAMQQADKIKSDFEKSVSRVESAQHELDAATAALKQELSRYNTAKSRAEGAGFDVTPLIPGVSVLDRAATIFYPGRHINQQDERKKFIRNHTMDAKPREKANQKQRPAERPMGAIVKE